MTPVLIPRVFNGDCSHAGAGTRQAAFQKIAIEFGASSRNGSSVSELFQTLISELLFSRFLTYSSLIASTFAFYS